MEDQEKKQVETYLNLKYQTKAIEGKSHDKLSMQEETYNALLEKRLSKI